MRGWRLVEELLQIPIFIAYTVSYAALCAGNALARVALRITQKRDPVGYEWRRQQIIHLLEGEDSIKELAESNKPDFGGK